MKSRSVLLSLIVIVVTLVSVSCAPAAPGPAPAAPAAPPAKEAPTEPTKTPEPPPAPEMPPLPPPVTCDPANPMLDPVKVVKGPETGRYGNQIYTMEAMYANPKSGQEFLLTASSGKAEELNKVVESLKVCYEVLDSGIPDTSGGKSDTSEEENLKWAIEFLNENPYNVLFESQLISALDAKPENIVVEYFVVDPTLDNDRVDDFIAKCWFSAWVSVTVFTNSASATLFRRATPVGSTNVAAAGTTSPTVSHSNGATKTTYDARVYGQAGTSYRLNGLWTKDASSVSLNACP